MPEEAIRVSDAIFDAIEATGAQPGDVLEAMVYSLVSFGRQHRASGDGLHRALSIAWADIVEALPGFAVEVVQPGDLAAELRKAAGQ